MSFFNELKRRNVVKVGIAYAIVAWVLVQIVIAVKAPLHLPEWADTMIIVLLAVGFPIVLIVTWAFELTPEGVRKTGEADQKASGLPEQRSNVPSKGRRGETRFCTTREDIRIAYTVNGSGYPVVKTSNWISNQELEWDSPIGPMTRDLSARYRLISYDGRGTGVSDRNVTEFSLDTMVEDMETVVDANKLDKFSIVAYSQSCIVSIAYTVKHPEHVASMVLFGGFLRNFRPQEEIDAMAALFAQSWGQDNPGTRQIFTTAMIPDATMEDFVAFNEFQRNSVAPDTVARLFRTIHGFDVKNLAKQITVPTLVMHSRDEPGVPLECGREMASLIPGARFIALESRNHVLLEREPAYKRFMDETIAFIDNNK